MVFFLYLYMHKNNPIGLFDSGIGGTTIWQAIQKTLPNERTIFLADQANAPYGIKSKAEIAKLCFKNIDFLLERDCKIIVVACNTATTNAIELIREKYSIPIIGIEPAIKPATHLTKTSTIGVLATKGTIVSDLFSQKIKLYPNVKIITQIGYELVTLIEKGEINSLKMTELLQQYLQPMVDKQMDTLVLGCTHYPYLIDKIKEIIPPEIQIIDSANPVARQTKHILEINDLLCDKTQNAEATFYTNVDPLILRNFTPENVKVIRENF